VGKCCCCFCLDDTIACPVIWSHHNAYESQNHDFRVSYITFGSGPGTTLGSLYFATWSSFYICIHLTVTAGNLFVTENNIRLVSGNDTKEESNVKETAAAAADEEAQVVKVGAKKEQTVAATNEDAKTNLEEATKAEK
jgi:hypothetical protein